MIPGDPAVLLVPQVPPPTKEDIELTLSAFDESMSIFKNIVSGNRPLRGFIEGEPVKPVFRKVADFNSYTTKQHK